MSWNKDNLKSAFEKAGLTLEFAKESFARGINGADVFGIDIRRKKLNDPHSEYFLMWPGHEDNNIVVRDTDKSFGQIVLTVSEAEREFEDTVGPSSIKWAMERAKGDTNKALADLIGRTHKGYPKVKTWKPKSNTLVILRMTPKDSRTFLLGMDERQLFITQVNRNVTTVKAAHDSLKAPSVRFFEGKAGGKTIRQGEWFFVNLTLDEERAINTALRKKVIVPRKKVPIGQFAGRGGGKPHTADELVLWDGNLAIEETTHKRIDYVPYTVPQDIVRVHLMGKTAQEGLNEMLRANHITMKEVEVWDSAKLLLTVRLPRAQSLPTPRNQPGRASVFVRGAVRHADHDTVKFSNWRRVIANTEAVVNNQINPNVGRGIGGGTWVD